MGFHVSVKDVLISGGLTLSSLILLSIYSIALIWERWRFYRRALGGQKVFLDKVRQSLEAGNPSDAIALSRSHKGLGSAIVMAGLVGPVDREERRGSCRRAAERAMAQLNARITTLGTIASVAPFIGLFGTVIGVMRAFRDLATAAGAGPGVVAIGISEALICTAAGLFVAIPALAAYNYFNHEALRFSDEMGWISDEILESLSEKSRR